MPEISEQQREYREVYLRSEHWRITRRAALERAEHHCQVCSRTGHLDVHHNTYERLGEERPADLLVLCRRCHDLFHAGTHARATKSGNKSKRKKQKRRKQPAPSVQPTRSEVHRVSEVDRERFDKMREAELERRRAEKRARAERREAVKRQRLARAGSGRDWRDERALPRKIA